MFNEREGGEMYDTGTTEGLENSMVMGNQDAEEISAAEAEAQRDELIDLFSTVFSRSPRETEVPRREVLKFWSWFDDRVRDSYDAESKLSDVICLLMRGRQNEASATNYEFVEGLVGQYVDQNFDELAHLLEGKRND